MEELPSDIPLRLVADVAALSADVAVAPDLALALAGAAAPSTVSAKRSRSSELAGGVPSLEEVYPVWLEASPGERCALNWDISSLPFVCTMMYTWPGWRQTLRSLDIVAASVDATSCEI